MTAEWPMRPIADRAMPVLGENMRASRLGFAWLSEFDAWLRVSDDHNRDGWRFDLCPPGTLPRSPERSHPVYRCWWDEPADRPLLVRTVRALLGLALGEKISIASTVYADDDGRRVA